MERITKHFSILNLSIGNILEWYDFGLFSIFSALFTQLFFPEENKEFALMTTFSIFAIGFFCRPLGALIFGYLGDKKGRASTLKLSILMISLPTLLIGFLPTYQQVGMAAPIILLIIRMWQGISIGGEYSGSLIYLLESAPKKHRAFTTSFASAGSNIGILLAALVGSFFIYTLTPTQLYSWGWRIPYLVSGALSLIIYFFRLQINETPVFQRLQKNHHVVKKPFITLIKTNLPALGRIFGLVCMGSTFYYFCFTYLPMFLQQQQTINLSLVTGLMTFFIALMVILIPCSGLLCDKFGRRRMLLFNASFVIVTLVPGYYFLHANSLSFLLTTLLVFTIGTSLEQGTTPVAVIENFPAAQRYLGVSLAYNLANGFLGGTVPLICTWLALHAFSALAPAIYILFFAIITWTVVYFFIPETT